MKIAKMFKTALQQALSMFVVSNRVYWVFRKFKRLETMDTAQETWLIDVDFAIHFVEPFKSRKAAQKAVYFAKQLQPWQDFVILHCH